MTLGTESFNRAGLGVQETSESEGELFDAFGSLKALDHAESGVSPYQTG